MHQPETSHSSYTEIPLRFATTEKSESKFTQQEKEEQMAANDFNIIIASLGLDKITEDKINNNSAFTQKFKALLNIANSAEPFYLNLLGRVLKGIDDVKTAKLLMEKFKQDFMAMPSKTFIGLIVRLGDLTEEDKTSNANPEDRAEKICSGNQPNTGAQQCLVKLYEFLLLRDPSSATLVDLLTVPRFKDTRRKLLKYLIKIITSPPQKRVAFDIDEETYAAFLEYAKLFQTKAIDQNGPGCAKAMPSGVVETCQLTMQKGIEMAAEQDAKKIPMKIKLVNGTEREILIPAEALAANKGTQNKISLQVILKNGSSIDIHVPEAMIATSNTPSGLGQPQQTKNISFKAKLKKKIENPKAELDTEPQKTVEEDTLLMIAPDFIEQIEKAEAKKIQLPVLLKNGSKRTALIPASAVALVVRKLGDINMEGVIESSQKQFKATLAKSNFLGQSNLKAKDLWPFAFSESDQHKSVACLINDPEFALLWLAELPNKLSDETNAIKNHHANNIKEKISAILDKTPFSGDMNKKTITETISNLLLKFKKHMSEMAYEKLIFNVEMTISEQIATIKSQTHDHHQHMETELEINIQKIATDILSSIQLDDKSKKTKKLLQEIKEAIKPALEREFATLINSAEHKDELQLRQTIQTCLDNLNGQTIAEQYGKIIAAINQFSNSQLARKAHEEMKEGSALKRLVTKIESLTHAESNFSNKDFVTIVTSFLKRDFAPLKNLKNQELGNFLFEVLHDRFGLDEKLQALPISYKALMTIGAVFLKIPTNAFIANQIKKNLPATAAKDALNIIEGWSIQAGDNQVSTVKEMLTTLIFESKYLPPVSRGKFETAFYRNNNTLGVKLEALISQPTFLLSPLHQLQKNLEEQQQNLKKSLKGKEREEKRQINLQLKAMEPQIKKVKNLIKEWQTLQTSLATLMQRHDFKNDFEKLFEEKTTRKLFIKIAEAYEKAHSGEKKDTPFIDLILIYAGLNKLKSNDTAKKEVGKLADYYLRVILEEVVGHAAKDIVKKDSQPIRIHDNQPMKDRFYDDACNLCYTDITDYKGHKAKYPAVLGEGTVPAVTRLNAGDLDPESDFFKFLVNHGVILEEPAQPSPLPTPETAMESTIAVNNTALNDICKDSIKALYSNNQISMDAVLEWGIPLAITANDNEGSYKIIASAIKRTIDNKDADAIKNILALLNKLQVLFNRPNNIDIATLKTLHRQYETGELVDLTPLKQILSNPINFAIATATVGNFLKIIYSADDEPYKKFNEIVDHCQDPFTLLETMGTPNIGAMSLQKIKTKLKDFGIVFPENTVKKTPENTTTSQRSKAPSSKNKSNSSDVESHHSHVEHKKINLERSGSPISSSQYPENGSKSLLISEEQPSNDRIEI